MSSLPFGSVDQAVAAGLVVRAGALHGRVVLRHVEIDRPGPQRGGHLPSASSKPVRSSHLKSAAGCDPPARCSPACRAACAPCRPGSRRVFGRPDGLEQAQHLLPTVHAAPANLAFGRQPFAEVLRQCRRPRRMSRRCVSCCLRGLAPNRARWPPNRCAPRRKAGCRGRAASCRCGTLCGPCWRIARALRRCPWPSRRRPAARPAPPASRFRGPCRGPCRQVWRCRRQRRRCSCVDRRGRGRRHRT